MALVPPSAQGGGVGEVDVGSGWGSQATQSMEPG